MLVDGEGVERYSHVQQVAPSRRSGGGGHVVAVFLVIGMQMGEARLVLVHHKGFLS